MDEISRNRRKNNNLNNKKFNSGNEIINKLENLYQKSQKEIKYTNLEKKTKINLRYSAHKSTNRLTKTDSKGLISIDTQQNQKHSKNIISNEIPTIDATSGYFSVSNSKNKRIQSFSPNKNSLKKNDTDLESWSILIENDQKLPHINKDYYASILNNNKNSKEREKLLQNSIDFYYHSKKSPISKSYSYRKKENEKENYEKPKIRLFSSLKRIPTKVAFGKVVTNDKINFYKKNENFYFDKQKPITEICKNEKNIFRKGLHFNNSIENLIKLNKIKDDYNTNNPNAEFYTPKDVFGNIIYPVYGQKKMLKNIMPKEYDYNTVRSPLELLHDTYHPLLRFQKKMLSQHINSINQEIGVTYSKYFTLVDNSKIPEKYKMCQDLIDLQKDEKLIKLIRDLIDRNFGLNKEVEKTFDKKKETLQEKLKKKNLYQRFGKIIIKAAIHFKKLNISLEKFYEKLENKNSYLKLDEKSKQKYELQIHKQGQHLFQAIKANDIEEILNVVKNNNNILFYTDHFKQTPLHICAKRNLYQLILLFTSKGININAQDEGGRTALYLAAERNHFEFVVVLLYEIADPKIQTVEGKIPSDVTTNSRLKIALDRAKILHFFHYIGKAQNFNQSVRNGLDFLFNEEFNINYKQWIQENNEIIGDVENKK